MTKPTLVFALGVSLSLAFALPVALAAGPESGWATELRSPHGQAEAQAVPGDYAIGARDLLEIRVFDLEQLDATVRVSENGVISLPLIGEFRVQGMTRAELEQALEAALVEFVNEPQVSVFIREYQSQRISVIGAVAEPGTYEMLGRTTLLEAISVAGGIDDTEASDSITIIRPDRTSGEPLNVSVDRLINQGDPQANIVLQSGDTVNLVPRPRYMIYVQGRVRSPGQYEVRERITLSRAVSLAGGLADGAAAKRVRILRMAPDGSQQSIKIDLTDIMDGEIDDILIEPDDVIVVPATFF